MSDIHPSPAEFSEQQLSEEQILRFFHYAHLPPHMAAISAPFCALARAMFESLPRSAERAAGLRKLLEAKDCAVRAASLSAA
jgi:hypothetical protein